MTTMANEWPFARCCGSRFALVVQARVSRLAGNQLASSSSKPESCLAPSQMSSFRLLAGCPLGARIRRDRRRAGGIAVTAGEWERG